MTSRMTVMVMAEVVGISARMTTVTVMLTARMTMRMMVETVGMKAMSVAGT
jgi:hypothetical protein